MFIYQSRVRITCDAMKGLFQSWPVRAIPGKHRLVASTRQWPSKIFFILVSYVASKILVFIVLRTQDSLAPWCAECCNFAVSFGTCPLLFSIFTKSKTRIISSVSVEVSGVKHPKFVRCSPRPFFKAVFSLRFCQVSNVPVPWDLHQSSQK